jgi:radical SAM/Cys-rich protein
MTTDLENSPKISVTPFHKKIVKPLTKNKITVLQINLGKRCNLACTHCHVEAGPKRTEEMSEEVCHQLIQLINQFSQIETVDLTGGAPEMNYGFKPFVKAARNNNKEVIVRSNLTIYFEDGFTDLPQYFAKNQVRVVASLPCYLQDNVDKMRGRGVYDASIKALQILNQLGYGRDSKLILDLVYNPTIPSSTQFSLPPEQSNLETAYKKFLQDEFGIKFNHLFTITNLPIGRTKFHLQHRGLEEDYLHFLEDHYNGQTVANLMCRNQLSIDYLGNVYDCDFNQMENLPAINNQKHRLTIKELLEAKSLDVINEVATALYCYGCTAGSGSSCGGALI